MDREGYKPTKVWSDAFNPEIDAILGQYLVWRDPSKNDDDFKNTDRICQIERGTRVSCRMRHFRDMRYQHQFTLRCSRPSGVPTELQKILTGWGDYMFYGIAAEDDLCIASWHLCDLDVFRKWYLPERNHRVMAVPDGSAEYMIFQYHELPETFVIAERIYTPGGTIYEYMYR